LGFTEEEELLALAGGGEIGRNINNPSGYPSPLSVCPEGWSENRRTCHTLCVASGFTKSSYLVQLYVTPFTIFPWEETISEGNGNVSKSFRINIETGISALD
jgi:hypothetical protein